MDDRMMLAGMALQGILASPKFEMPETPRSLVETARIIADALIYELSQVPAPSGNPATDPPCGDPTSAGSSTQGAANPVARDGSNAAFGDRDPAGVSTPGDTNPARPPSRKAKPSTPCGGPRCREDAKQETHDVGTCPKFSGKAAKAAARGCSEEKR